jgi:uncharacterized protein (UPF0333 family)
MENKNMVTLEGKILVAYEIIYNNEPLGYPVHVEKKNIESYVNKLQKTSKGKISYRIYESK